MNNKTSLLLLATLLLFSISILALEEGVDGVTESLNDDLELVKAPADNMTDNAEKSQQAIEEQEYLDWAQGLWDSLDRLKGEVVIESAGVTLNIPESYYYLSTKDAEKVLVDIWGNPPGQQVLGMMFSEEFTPFDDNAWAVTVEYEEDGYVSDEDANDIDYSELLLQMKEDTSEASKQRIAQGYGPVSLVGWAEVPFYNEKTNKMHWAKELSFGGEGPNTLNYNVRALGRKGVLVLNFIASIDQKELIQSNVETVMAMAEFNDGSRYADFKPGVDKVAAYGLGALVAGKVLAKTGLIAAALIFLKKFGIFIVLGIGALFRKIFSKKEN